MRESRLLSEGWQGRHDWRWWKEWMSKEEKRGEKRKEEQRPTKVESRLREVEGW